MNLKTFVWLSATVLLTFSRPGAAQQAMRVHRIGYLSSLAPARESARSEAIRLGLRELGYVQGYNVAIEYRYAAEKRDRLAELATDLVRPKVDVIVAAGANSVVGAARNATKTIPIVMSGGGIDPVELGFVESLARPGGNITGVTNLGPELGAKRLELLKESIPKISRVSVLYDPDNPPSALQMKQVLPTAARALGLTVQPQEVKTTAGFDRAFAALTNELPDGLFVLGGPLMYANQKRTVRFGLTRRLPSAYNREEDVEAGGLMSYGADLVHSYRRVAYYVDRIFKGAKPADLPVEQPTKFEFVVNLKTAKQIGLTIPANVLARADRVIR